MQLTVLLFPSRRPECRQLSLKKSNGLLLSALPNLDINPLSIPCASHCGSVIQPEKQDDNTDPGVLAPSPVPPVLPLGGQG